MSSCEAVQPNAFAISARSFFTLTKHQAMGDLNQIFAMTKRDGAAFHLASIPASFNVKSAKAFDQTYMRALFDIGQRIGRQSDSWAKSPQEALLMAAR